MAGSRWSIFNCGTISGNYFPIETEFRLKTHNSSHVLLSQTPYFTRRPTVAGAVSCSVTLTLIRDKDWELRQWRPW